MELKNPKKTVPVPPLDTDLLPSGGGGGMGERMVEKQQHLLPGAGPLGSPTAAAAAALAEAAGAAETSLQKKLRRAERFGVAVQLSEEEKRSSRAERFGTAPSLPGKSEEQKRKERAERFGLPGQLSANEEEKKKARLARFSQDNKVNGAEEEKRKARALRFSQTTPTVASNSDTLINPDQEKPAVLGRPTRRT